MKLLTPIEIDNLLQKVSAHLQLVWVEAIDCRIPPRERNLFVRQDKYNRNLLYAKIIAYILIACTLITIVMSSLPTLQKIIPPHITVPITVTIIIVGLIITRRLRLQCENISHIFDLLNRRVNTILQLELEANNFNLIPGEVRDIHISTTRIRKTGEEFERRLKHAYEKVLRERDDPEVSASTLEISYDSLKIARGYVEQIFEEAREFDIKLPQAEEVLEGLTKPAEPMWTYEI